ncbi:FecR family protein [Peristeroidobacter soli]|jgi:transmembrane sensor|uniref:FecR family protein n=1 Tax=Peristeroidobacter soli TaxID=2497877 RepID=UPI00101C855E|nr:FecR domain-containing protein [Peristeroidobacter soli]
MRQEQKSSAVGMIDERARRWLVQVHGGALTAPERAEFEAWLSADVAHRDAYRCVEQLWRDVSVVGALSDVDVSKAAFSRRRTHWSLAAASVVLAVALTFLLLTTGGTVYRTGRGEVRELALADGSHVTLGARSKLRVTFVDTERRADLEAGEAFFSVAKDRTRPFYVRAGDTMVRVVGTQFDLRHGAGNVHVAVKEGVVEVMPAAHAQQPDASVSKRTLTAGQEAVSSGAAIEVHSIVAVEAGAWRVGRLSYENTRLAEVIADANRYSDSEIVFADDRLREVPVTAAFRTDQIDTMLDSLAGSQPIVVDRSRAGRIVLRAAR